MAPAWRHEQEVVVITGCSEGGIGDALADAFARADYKVIATARNLALMKPLEQNANVELLELDVTSGQDVLQEAIDGVIAKFGHVDILVNNAGANCIGPIAVVPRDSVESCYRTNVFGRGPAHSKLRQHLIQSSRLHLELNGFSV